MIRLMLKAIENVVPSISVKPAESATDTTTARNAENSSVDLFSLARTVFSVFI